MIYLLAALITIGVLIAWAGYNRGYRRGLEDANYQELPY